jgi:signal transduction histidine kinase
MSSVVVGLICDIGFVILLWFSLRKLLVRPLLTLRQAAIAIKVGKRTKRLEMNASLEITEVADAFNDMVENLDARYGELRQALHTLQNTQEQLIQSEKMSALGRLVAGVAHEINTPLGVGVTAISYLDQRTKEFTELYGQNRMKKSDLESYIKMTQETTGIIQTNLLRASELIKSFKQVSVDQTHEEKRTFRLLEYIEDILRSLQPTIRKTKQRIAVLGDHNLEVSTNPGVVSQIVTNLVMNSLTHAYEPGDEGYMLIRIQCEEGHLAIQYADDGKGMTKDVADKIFDPFFTTNRSKGGTGLGMNIVYNLITQKLGGTIHCFSEPGRGTTFIIDIPTGQEKTHELQQYA